MKASSKRLLLAGWILLSLALLIPLASAFYGLLAPRAYRAINRLEIQPVQADIFHPAFRDSLFGPDSSIRIEQTRITSLVQVVSRTENPRDSAELANAAAARIQAILRDRPGVAVQMVDPAEPSLRPHAPNIPLLVTVGGGSGFMFALGAAILLVVGHFRRRAVEESPYSAS